MNTVRTIAAGALVFCIAVSTVAGEYPANTTDGKPQFSTGLNLGYYQGTGVQVSSSVSDFAVGFPFVVRVGVGYTSVEPGKAADARRIFINDATNGIPEKHGRTWDFSLNFLYPVHLLRLPRSYLFVGPRYVRYTGNFKFIGGNEDFDVKSRQWGAGLGLETYFAVSPRVDLVLQTGYDYFASAALSGHDTSYNPDGDDINPRQDYTYEDADDAIHQPRHQLRLMIGFSYRY